MRIAKNILIVLGILFIVINVLAFFGGVNPIHKDKTLSISSKIAYFIGTNIFLIVGGILLLIAHFLNKKIRSRKDKALVESLFKDVRST